MCWSVLKQDTEGVKSFGPVKKIAKCYRSICHLSEWQIFRKTSHQPLCLVTCSTALLGILGSVVNVIILTVLHDVMCDPVHLVGQNSPILPESNGVTWTVLPSEALCWAKYGSVVLFVSLLWSRFRKPFVFSEMWYEAKIRKNFLFERTECQRSKETVSYWDFTAFCCVLVDFLSFFLMLDIQERQWMQHLIQWIFTYLTLSIIPLLPYYTQITWLLFRKYKL